MTTKRKAKPEKKPAAQKPKPTPYSAEGPVDEDMDEDEDEDTPAPARKPSIMEDPDASLPPLAADPLCEVIRGIAKSYPLVEKVAQLPSGAHRLTSVAEFVGKSQEETLQALKLLSSLSIGKLVAKRVGEARGDFTFKLRYANIPEVLKGDDNVFKRSKRKGAGGKKKKEGTLVIARLYLSEVDVKKLEKLAGLEDGETVRNRAEKISVVVASLVSRVLN